MINTHVFHLSATVALPTRTSEELMEAQDTCVWDSLLSLLLRFPGRR